MSARSAAALAVQEVPKAGTGLLLAVAAAIVCPFDGVLAGMIRAGLGVDAICAYLGLSRAILDHNLIRLDLPTPHDRLRRKGGRRPWNDNELRCAIYWRCLGIHPESIGIPFNRSAGAVRSKMRRLGVPTPDRKKLHKVDPATLDLNPPDFEFPVPPDDRPVASTTGFGNRPHNTLAIVPATPEAAPAANTTPQKKNGARKSRDGVVPSQRDLTLLRVMPTSKAEPADVSGVPAVDVLSEKNDQSLFPVCEATGNSGDDRVQVLGEPDLVRRYQVVGPVRRPDSNEAFLKWMALLYLGGMHCKAIAVYLGRSASSVQAIMYRMGMPRDRSSEFGWTCDLECAVATLENWDYVLIRCNAKEGLAEHERPLFWRPKDAKGIRRRRCTRLRNNELEDWFKHRDGNTVKIMTRAQLDAQRRILNTTDGAQRPARLHASMQGSLPIHLGAVNEQFKRCGHTPSVRSGFPGHAGDPMPWAHPGNGGAARPVAHP